MDPASLRRQVYGLLIIGAVAVTAGRVANLQQTKLRTMDLTSTHGSNDRSRWATVRALVDNQTYVVGQRDRGGAAKFTAIIGAGATATTMPTIASAAAAAIVAASARTYEDTGIVFEDGWKTVDKVLDPEPARENVHYFYSSKPPLFPTLVAGEYWLLKQLGLSITGDLAWVVRIILLTVNVLPFGIYLYLLSRLAEAYGMTDWGRYFVIFAAGFATFLTTFSNTLNNHSVSTCLALFGLAAFLRIWSVPRLAITPEAKETPAAAKPELPAAATSPPPPEPAASSESPASEPAPATEGDESDFAGFRMTEPTAITTEKPASPSEEVFSTFRATETPTPEAGPDSGTITAPVQPVSGLMYFWAGLFSALAAAFELPALAFTVGIFALLLVHDRGRALKFFLPPALLVAGLFFLTNYLALGRLVPAYAEVGSKSAWYLYEGSHWLNPSRGGIDFANEDKLTYSFHFLIGHHGVFALSPIFLLSLIGIGALIWKGRKAKDSAAPPRSMVVLAWLTLYLTVVVLGFYIYKTNNYSGFSSGPRWLMWLTPFWLLTLLPVADKLSGCRWGRSLALICLFLSVLSASYATWIPWQHPWIYRYVEELGWMKY